MALDRAPWLPNPSPGVERAHMVKPTPARLGSSRVDAGNQAGGGRFPDRIDP